MLSLSCDLHLHVELSRAMVMPTNYPALLKLLRIHPNRLPIILTMAPWEPTLHDLEICARDSSARYFLGGGYTLVAIGFKMRAL